MIRARKYIGWFLLVICIPLFVPAQSVTNSFGFIENKGQWPSAVLYSIAPSPNVTVFVERDGIRFNIVNAGDMLHSMAHHHSGGEEESDVSAIRGHAYKMYFVGGSLGPDIETSEPSSDYLNYIIGNDATRWVSMVRKYKWVTLKNVYQGVDLFIGQQNNNLKLEWRIYPGGSASSISIRYDGTEGVEITEGRLSIHTSVGEVSEGYPKSWAISNGIKVPVSGDYVKNGKNIGFGLQSVPDAFDTLVIDPELVFSTYSGSTADNWGFTATYDYQGNVYSGGIVFGAGYPVTVGAWQQTYAGGWDVAIIKYDSTGTIRRWATYLGGDQADLPHSIICDEGGNLYVFGTTGSAGFPVTPGAYDLTFNGGTSLAYDQSLYYPQGSDVFVSKLSSDGSQLLASTFIGGTGNDGLNYRSRYNLVVNTGNDTLYCNYGDGARGEIAIDAQNYIYIGSCTFSTDYPITSGAFQPTNRGKQEGVVTKLSSTLGTLVWSSYVGGSGDDAVYSIDVTSTGNVLAAGGTTSTNLLTTPGVPKPQFQGGTADGFLLKISPNGNAIDALTYFGSNQYDQAYFVRTDRFNNAYIYGQTKATGTTLVSNAAYYNTNSGQFIAKYNSSLSVMLWSSVFGSGRTGPEISPTAFSVDVCNRIYVSGWGRYWGGNGVWGTLFGTKGFPITTDAWQSQSDGQDFYIGVFDSDMSGLEYGTFFGELHYSGCSGSGRDHVDGGTSRFDRNGNIYQSVCASCGGCQQFPTFPDPGAWSNTNNSSNCNNAVFKINLITDFALASFNSVSPGCTPYSVQFQNAGRASSWQWNFDDPASGPANTSTQKNPQHTFSQSGNYNVCLIANWPISCNLSDTMYRVVTVLSDSVYSIDTITVCNGEAVQIGIQPSPDPSITYSWTPITGLSDPHVSNPVAKPVVSTSYLLVTGNGICTDSIYQMVMVEDVWLNIPSDTVVCDTTALLSAVFSPGATLVWSSSLAFNDTLNEYPYGASIVVHGQGNFSFYVSAQSDNGCRVIDSVHLILSKPDAEINGPALICQGDSVWFTIEESQEGCYYQWKSSAAILTGQGTGSVQIRPFTSGYIAVKVTDTLSGCCDTAIFIFFVSSFQISLQTVPTTCFDTCDGEASLMISGGHPPYQITWMNGQTGVTAGGLCSGFQWVKIADAVGCDSLFLFTMPSPPEILTNDTSANVSCPGMTDGFITLNTSGGVPPYTWQWNTGATTESLESLPPGIYRVAITDGSGCKLHKTWIIAEPAPLEVDALVANIACHGDSTGSITLTISGGSQPYLVVWNNGMGGPSVSGVPAGFYQAMITDTEGCELTFDTVLSEPAEPIDVNAVLTSPQCFNTSDGSIILTVEGGIAPYLIIWSTGSIGPALENIMGGDYGAELTDAAGCHKLLSFNLPLPDSMVITALAIPPSCNNGQADGSILLTVTGGELPLTITWSNGQTGYFIQALRDGLYTATVADARRCVQIYTVNLPAPLPIQINGVTVEPSCFAYNDGSINTNVTGGTSPYRYQWNTGPDGPSLNQLSKGTYQISVTDAHLCVKDSVIFVGEPEEMTVKKFLTLPECRGASNGAVRLVPAGGTPPYTVIWDDGMEGLVKEGISSGIYNFSLTDSHNCNLDDSTRLAEQDCELVIPNVITPNNDGINDFFEIPNISYYPDNELFILNRWGREVRHYDSYQGEWDGRDQSGTPVADGTYYYILILRNVKQYQGIITVLR